MGRERRWRFRFHDRGESDRLIDQLGVTPLVAQLLVSRGLTDPSDAKLFLDSRLNDLRDPFELPGVSTAVEIIEATIAAKERICVYGDYDVDGMTATAILYRVLEAIGADVTYYIPNRLDEGYGLNSSALSDLDQRGVKLVISVDCGIASIEQVDHAKSIGLRVVITDHHQFAPTLPNADAIVHPSIPGSNYPFTGLCGAGVAFKLAWAISQSHCGGGKVTAQLRRLLMRSLALAAMGTVADVVPLVDENRTIVRHGLTMLQEDPATGVAALMRLTKLDKKRSLASEDIAFSLAPRLNAAGRLGYARLGAELLITESTERAEALAEHIDRLNQDREKLERRILTSAKAQIKESFDPQNNAALVLASVEWHVGVIGIVAGRIAERFNRPTVLIALDNTGMKPGTGSARTASQINLHEALSECSAHLESFGGHAAAAGLKIKAENVDAFREELSECVSAMGTDVDTRPELNVDIEAALSQLTLQSVQEIESLAPFGQSNPRPVFCASDVRIVGTPKRMGGGERHLSVQVEQSKCKLRGVAFGKGEWADELASRTESIDIVFRPVINEFAGRRNVEIHLIDWRPHSTVPAPHVATNKPSTQPADEPDRSS